MTVDLSPKGHTVMSDAVGPVLQVAGLTKTYGRVVAVDNCTFDVCPGDIFGLLGPNGAGKTTTLRMLVGLVRPDRGKIAIFGRNVRSAASPPTGVGAQIERPGVYPYLSAVDNLVVVATAGGLEHPTRTSRQLLAVVGLEADRDRRVRDFSTGMRQRLAIAMGLLGEPQLLLLDEPTTGLDPEGLVEIRSLLHELRDRGVTLLLSSHLLGEVEQVCNRIAVMRRGRVVACDSVDAFAASDPELLIRFARPEDSRIAMEILRQSRMAADLRDIGAGLLVLSGPSLDGEAAARALGAAGLFASEITPRRRSLESRYLELIGSYSDASDGEDSSRQQ